MKFKTTVAAACLSLLAYTAQANDAPGVASGDSVRDDGTIMVPAFPLPFSEFASGEARALTLSRYRSRPLGGTTTAEIRRNVDEAIFAPSLRASAARYPYTSTKALIGGVPTETFTPRAGIAPENRGRVLINLHGGGFTVGTGGVAGAAESVPIAALARMRVVAVDFRQGPEFRFPAASEDVTKVYRELLKSHRPQDIGIYGCSSGGMLTAQMIPWLLQKRLPLPGAIGILCSSTRPATGDSNQIWSRVHSYNRMVPYAGPSMAQVPQEQPYLGGQSTANPLVVPAASKEVLRQFPPTLFVTGYRSHEASSAAESHIELLELGVKSQLVMFDGMEHGFYNDALPEAERAHRIVAQFFLANLGKVNPAQKRRTP